MLPIRNMGVLVLNKSIYKEFFNNNNWGIYVDVGAGKPDYLSNSLFFRQKGWRVVAIEPNPHFCKIYRDLGYEINEYACADYNKDDESFILVNSFGASRGITYEAYSSLGFRYGKPVYYTEREIIKVKVRTLDYLLNDVAYVNIISIDVEGWELEVLKGWSRFDFYKPQVVIVENLLNNKEYETFMNEHQYSIWKKVFPNEIYIRE